MSLRRRHPVAIIRWRAGSFLAAGLLLLALSASSEVFTIETPVGSIQVDIPHVDPGGSLVEPAAPESPSFRPPSIFSAPLPSGSGARALGLAGAFTAVADDATAASWNPAGLIHLEVPEVSIMLRASREEQEHRSGSGSFSVGRNEFGNETLNYLSVVYPFRLADRNVVVSLNYQEAYDFTQEFTADLTERRRGTESGESSAEYRDTLLDHFEDPFIEIDLVSRVTTRKTSLLDQVVESDLLTDLDFEQAGIIDAVTPSVAVELTPRLFVGASFNAYQDSLFGERIRSRTRARYSGTAESVATVTDERTSWGTYTYSGVFHPPGGGPDVPIGPASGEYPPFTDVSESTFSDAVEADGEFEEINEFSDLRGYNGTFGVLWTANRFLSLGGSVDLPWTAEADQKKTLRNTVTTYDRGRTRVVGVTQTEEVERRSVEFEFPLYWAVGAVLRWNNRLYTTLDLSETLWSDFSFKAEGEERINPLDGTPHGQNEIGDCWAVRAGIEYLWVLRNTEVPFRAGLAMEQRPAIGDPDEFWSASLGSGVSFGKGHRKFILDAAYVYTRGEDVLKSLVPDAEDLSSDVSRHQLFLSCIRHF